MPDLPGLSRKLRNLGVVLFPLLLVPGYVVLKEATGPYFYSRNSDPDYVYLFNSLHLALGERPVHIDHPGTPLHLLGAAAIKITNLSRTSTETAVNTIVHGESYLDGINLCLAGMLLLLLVVGGALIYRATEKAWTAILFHGAILLLGGNVYCLARVNPEPLLVLISVLLGLLIWLSFVQGGDFRSPAFIATAALLCATGITTKITFAPLAVLPLLLIPSWRRKGIYVGLSGLFVALWLLPIWKSMGRFGHWLSALATRTGRYGTGEPGVLDVGSYMANIVYLASENLPFICLLAGSLAVAIYFRYVRAPDASEPCQRTAAGVLLTVAALQGVQMAMVCKYRESRYLVPAMGLAGVNLLLLARLLPGRRVFGFACAGLLGLGLWGASTRVRALAAEGAENGRIFQAAQSLPTNSVRIFCYGASSPYYAAYFGNSFTDGFYGTLLTKLISDSDRIVFYNNFQRSYRTFLHPVSLESILNSSGSVFYQTPPFVKGDLIYDWPAGVKLREYLGGNYERIYQVVPQ
ncbi:MAG: hypothetical protein L0Y58_25650 [Verrucomicrobia subdivision 3 bacterium]|nr:hypothetical protein [Limisphaerales bacterium]